jgi:hypothetical protein
LEGCSSLQNRKLARVIETCTQFDPERRYANIRQLQQDLRFAARAQTRPVQLFLRGTGVGLAAGFGLAVLLGAVGVLPPQWSPKQAVANVPLAQPSPAATSAYVTFDSPEIEQAVRAQLGVGASMPLTQADLDRVTKLYFFGADTLTNWSDAAYRSLYRTNTPSGTIQTLSDIPKFRNLTDLAVGNQSITDLSPLAGLNLVHLALGGNQISDLSPLKSLPYLNELYVGYNPVVSIDAISECPFLRVLDVSGTSIIDLSPLASLNLQSLYLKNIPGDEYSFLTNMPSLERFTASNVNERRIETISQMSSLTYLEFEGTAPDITPLLKLKQLTGLMLFDQQLTSLEGIESLSHLNYLLLYCAPNIDLTPLTQLPNLASLDIVSQKLKDYSVLFSLKNLSVLYCKAEQKAAIEATGEKVNFEVIVL